jgi:hypothetical protein
LIDKKKDANRLQKRTAVYGTPRLFVIPRNFGARPVLPR